MGPFNAVIPSRGDFVAESGAETGGAGSVGYPTAWERTMLYSEPRIRIRAETWSHNSSTMIDDNEP